MARKKTAAPTTIYDREAADPNPAIVVFGMTDKGLPQASWFSGVDAEVALKAAQLIGLHAAEITTDKHKAVAERLRQGQVFSNDKLFAPIIGQELYNELFELCGSTPIGDPVRHHPSSWDDIKVGSIVLAVDEDPGDGWDAAVVMASNDHLLQLRWLHAPRDATVIRSRSQVGLPAPEPISA